MPEVAINPNRTEGCTDYLKTFQPVTKNAERYLNYYSKIMRVNLF